MKAIAAVLLFTFSASVMSATIPCKIEAHSAAAKLYSSENPDTGFFVRAKFKPVLDEKIVHHMVEILESEGGRSTQMTVSLNSKTCSVLSID